MFLGNSIKGILLLFLSHIFLPLLLSMLIPTVPLVFLGYVLPFPMEHKDKEINIFTPMSQLLEILFPGPISDSIHNVQSISNIDKS